MNTGLLLLITLLITPVLSAQESFLQLESLEPEQVMTALFESERYSPEMGVAWVPDLEERATFVVSDDGYCHTKLDTVITYTINGYSGEETYALVVFATYAYYDGEPITCHACAPEMGAAQFVRTGEGWELERFRKFLGRFGGWGDPGDAALVHLGQAQVALEIASGFTGQGYTYSYSVWFNLLDWGDAFPEIFEYQEVYGPGGCEEECDAEWCSDWIDISREITFEPNSNPESDYSGYDDMVVTTISRTCRGETEEWSERYSYGSRGYERQCEE